LGEILLSKPMTSSFLPPSTPPALLISSAMNWACRKPLVPTAANGPDSGSMNAIRTGSAAKPGNAITPAARAAASRVNCLRSIMESLLSYQ